MAVVSAGMHPATGREASATLFGQTMGLVAATAGFFAVGAYLGEDHSDTAGFFWFIAAFACLIGLNVVARRSADIAVVLLFAFGVLIGLATAPTVGYYATTDPEAVWQAGGATALFIAAFGTAGYAIRRDLSGLARWLLWALVALLVFGVVLIFVEIPNGSLVYAIAGLAIFAGLTTYDFQRLRRTKDLDAAPLLAVSIFLDILNAFLLFLTIFSGGTRE